MNIFHIAIKSLLYLCLAGIVPLIYFLKERCERIKSEKMLETVRLAGEIDDQIWRMRIANPECWTKDERAQNLIKRRIILYEKYAEYIGHHPLRECEYMKDLMASVISK